MKVLQCQGLKVDRFMETRHAGMRFRSKNILVTGGASGIGKAAALRFAQEGGRVILADIQEEEAQSVADLIRDKGGKAAAVQADVRDPISNQQMTAAAIELFGDLNIVFANAGIGGGALAVDMTPDRWENILQTNLSGVFYTCKYTIPSLIKQPGNAIVTMGSSMAGWDTGMAGAAYMASKEGVTGMTKSLALQLARFGVRVNSICPGIIRTSLGGDPENRREVYEDFARKIPLRRVGEAEDVAAAVAFLASDDARHITGSMLLIDGGQTLQSWSNAPDEQYPLEFVLDLQ
jgi:NAD(P)-dependent dehydrogenase (short-subunit alcohol dehydrogenase family)